MKKLLLLFITVLTVTLADAQAVDDVFTVGDISYKVTSILPNEAEVTGSTLATPVIPSSETDPGNSTAYSIVAIAKDAFNANVTITSVELPSSVTLVGENGFRNATNLASVTFTTSSGITHIDRQGFGACPLTNVDDIISVLETTGNGVFNGCNITGTLTIPSSFNTTGTSVFRGNPNLTAVDMSAATTYTTIANQMFQATGLTSVILPTATTSIGAATFRDCAALASISIPAGVTTLGNNVFRDCTMLESIEVNNDAPATITVGGNDTFLGLSGTAILYTPNATAEAAYEANADWLSVFDAARIIVTGTLSVNNLEEELDFSIFPNPTEGIVSVKSKQLNNANVSVYDLNGRVLLSNKLNGTFSEINISNLTSGVYLLKIQAANREFVKRIVKQ